MTETWSLEKYRHEMGLPQLAGKPAAAKQQEVVTTAPVIPKPSKMRNVPTYIDTIRFDSRIEGAYYLQLLSETNTGIVSHFFRQVRMECGAGVGYVLDFLVVYTDGSLQYVDVKGHVTRTYKNKKKQIEDRYPIQIKEVYRKDISAFYIASAKAISEMAFYQKQKDLKEHQAITQPYTQ